MANIVDFISFPKVTGECGYFSDRACSQIYTYARWISDMAKGEVPLPRLYSDFKEKGFCRYHSQFYLPQCYGCSQCKAIRLRVKNFKASKSQRSVLRKNDDVSITIVRDEKDFVTDEKVLMFREYDNYHNKDSRKTLAEARTQLTEMNSGYDGIWNMEYRLNDRLIGVGIIDYTTDSYNKINALCSNYFYYDTTEDIRKRSLGVFSVLKEIELCLNLEVPFYYLGFYLSDCKKMNYKANYKPYELYYKGKWIDGSKLSGGVTGAEPLLEGVSEDACAAELRGRLSPPSEKIKEILLPPAGSISSEYPEICFITEDIKLQFLYSAYRQGIFPWFNEDEGDPVLWQCPDQRFVIFPENLHVGKSIEKALKRNEFTYTVDTCFEEVMKNCSAQVRAGQNGSWIGKQMLAAYADFFKAGYAHSIEVWKDGKLAGGFYGVLMGSVFCGESMFTIEPDSSKTAFVIFAREFFANGGKMIDCQAYTENMARYGAVEIPRDEFLKIERPALDEKIDWEHIIKVFKN